MREGGAEQRERVDQVEGGEKGGAQERLLEAKAAPQDEEKGEPVENHDGQEKDVQLVDGDGAVHPEDGHTGEGAEPHEEDGPAELGGLPLPEDVEEKGKEEGGGGDATAEEGRHGRELADGFGGGIGEEIGGFEAQVRFEVGEEGQWIGAGFAVELVEGEAEGIVQGAPVVPSPG